MIMSKALLASIATCCTDDGLAVSLCADFSALELSETTALAKMTKDAVVWDLLSSLCTRREIDVDMFLERSLCDCHDCTELKSKGHLTACDVRILKDMRRLLDYLGGKKEMLDTLEPPGTRGGRLTSLCWHRIATARIDREMAAAIIEESALRRDARTTFLSRGDDDGWRELVVDLSTLTPVSSDAGVERLDAVLRRHRPKRWMGSTHALKTHGRQNPYEEPRRQFIEGDAVLAPSSEWAKNIPEQVLRVLVDVPGVVLAGGGALDCVDSFARTPNDYDLFITGVGDAATGTAVLKRIVRTLGSKNIVTQHRSQHAVTIGMRRASSEAFPFPTRCYNVQVILRLYANPAEVILGFDVDPCKVALLHSAATEGGGRLEAFATQTAIVSMKRLALVANPERRSPTYADRLWKYSHKKGFVSIVPMKLDRYVQQQDENITFSTCRSDIQTSRHPLFYSLVDISSIVHSVPGGLASLIRLENALKYMAVKTVGGGATTTTTTATASDYDGEWRRVETKTPWWRKLHTVLLAHVSRRRATENDEKYTFINWKTIDPAAQDSPVSNTFHPGTHDFYDCYVLPFDVLLANMRLS